MWGPNADEVLDCKIDGFRKGSSGGLPLFRMDLSQIPKLKMNWNQKKSICRVYQEMDTLCYFSKRTSIFPLRVCCSSARQGYCKVPFSENNECGKRNCEKMLHYEAIMECSFKGREIGNEKLIAILDLRQLAYKNIDIRGFINGFQLLQAYYPERLAKCFILDMPWFFVSVWRLISHFLEKATLEKIVIVTNEEERKDFVKEIGEDVLPEEYGGCARLIPLQDVTMPPLAEC